MKKVLFFALTSMILMSCGTSHKAQKVAKNDIIYFTKQYRDLFTDAELKDAENAAFINQTQIELIGLPGNTKDVWFENNYLIEGNWKHIIIPAGTTGKITSIKESNEFLIEFDAENKIEIIFLIDSKKNNYELVSFEDENPKIPPGIKSRYKFSPGNRYQNYLGGKFYFIAGSDESKLLVNHKVLEEEVIILRGRKK